MKKVTPQAGTHLQVSTTFAGQEREKSYHKSEITIGRANGVARPDLDLSPDVNVSRRHARLWVEEGDFWIEDLAKYGFAFEYKLTLDRLHNYRAKLEKLYDKTTDVCQKVSIIKELKEMESYLTQKNIGVLYKPFDVD